MQQRGASPKKRNQTSPKRAVESPVASNGHLPKERFTKTLLEQGDASALQLLLKEKEIELEHKLNTLIALNEKLQVFNDLKKDVAEN